MNSGTRVCLLREGDSSGDQGQPKFVNPCQCVREGDEKKTEQERRDIRNKNYGHGAGEKDLLKHFLL